MGLEAQTQLSGKAKHTHYQGGFIKLYSRELCSRSLRSHPETGSSNTAADLAALLSMQMATQAQLFSGGQNSAILSLKENRILMRTINLEALEWGLKLGSLSLSFENVDHGAKSMKGGSALLLPTGPPCEQGSLGRATGSFCSPCSIWSTRIRSLPCSLRF